MPAVVTCILLYEDKMLLLKRSNQVSTYQGQWAGVSGYVEPGDDVRERAIIEITEEIGLRRDQVQLITQGEPIEFYDPGETQRWCVHPFLFSTCTNKVTLDWEHDDYAWVSATQLDNYNTVPKLKETVQQLLP